jgi:hypothetical protein
VRVEGGAQRQIRPSSCFLSIRIIRGKFCQNLRFMIMVRPSIRRQFGRKIRRVYFQKYLPEWKPKMIFSHAINCLLAALCSHLWPLVHNTVFRKPIIAHLLVHEIHWNITSSTGIYTLPVNFDQPVHPITLQLKTILEKTLRCRVSLFFLIPLF